MFDTITNIKIAIEKLSKELLVSSASPNTNLIKEAMNTDAALVSSLSDDTLSSYILVLGQYLVMLQYNENTYNINYMLYSNALNFEITKIIFKDVEVGKLKTEKAKRNYIILNYEDIQKLQAQVLQAQAEKMLLENMGNACGEFLNSLKKEKNSRDSEWQRGQGHGQNY